MILKQFIDAGLYTVPLRGTLKRQADGKKTQPIFEANWRDKYTKKRNTLDSDLGGLLTGSISNVIAIDCDNEVTFQVFKSLDTDYNVHFISKDKPEGGGTILYKYCSEFNSFRLSDNSFALDFFSDEGFIYLPTEKNETKEIWPFEKFPELKEAPETVKALLKTLSKKQSNISEIKSIYTTRLAPMLETFVKEEEYQPSLFKIITPYSFRDLPSYVTQGHLHPNNIPNGRGSEYLSKISAILGADISVSKELYQNTMLIINDLWDKPIDIKRLKNTIINPMIEEKVIIDNKVVWKYDKYWKKSGFIFTDLNGECIESFFDDVKSCYFIINYNSPYVKVFNEKNKCISTLKALTGRKIIENDYDRQKKLIKTVLNPSKEFGHIKESSEFNLFRQTSELNILNNPEIYAFQYKRPEITVRYLETLIPDEFMRNYILSFVKTKLITFKYSPIVLYFIGSAGSGKDTFVSLLADIIGTQYIAKPETKVFLEQYNGWIVDKYFVQLDEYGNKLSRNFDKQEALGKVKSYSGSPEIQIRAMRQEGYNYKHSVTLIITSNTNPLPIETQDRRIAFISTPNRLDKQKWVKDYGGISRVIERLHSEIQDFCYYLATEIEVLSDDEYVIAPETKDKEKLIIDNLPTYKKIIYFMNTRQYDKLEELGIEYGVNDLTKGWSIGRIIHDKLIDLYLIMTENQGDSRALIRALKMDNYHRTHTTMGGESVSYYYINDLVGYESKHGFKPVNSTTIDIDIS